MYRWDRGVVFLRNGALIVAERVIINCHTPIIDTQHACLDLSIENRILNDYNIIGLKSLSICGNPTRKDNDDRFTMSHENVTLHMLAPNR